MNILFQHHLKPASFIVNVQVSYFINNFFFAVCLQSQRQTAKVEKACQPRSVPLMTMNPLSVCLQIQKKKGESQKEKISRYHFNLIVFVGILNSYN